jgi:hypothetical protein
VTKRDDDESMMRKVFVSVLGIVATLVVVPSVLAALSSRSAFGASSRNAVTRGWASPEVIDTKRLRIGVPVTQSFTIANDGSLPAVYALTARIAGDTGLAERLSVVATRRSDGATIFSGPATRLRRLDLGGFEVGQHETLRLRVTLTSTATHARDNVSRGHGASVAFTWTAAQA